MSTYFATNGSGGQSARQLKPLEKELLAFIFARVGNLAGAELAMSGLKRHFAEVSTEAFLDLCWSLIDAGMLATRNGQAIALTDEGMEIATSLQGGAGKSAPAAEQEPDFRPSSDEHLVWDLSKLADYEKACHFALRFRLSLCVFSPPVQQLYTNYNIVVPKDNQRKLIILPNPYADHDTFNYVNADAAVPTRMYITPGANDGLVLHIPVADGTWHPMPISDGFSAVQKKFGSTPFLPVVAKGDLREVQPNQPIMHLHRMDMSRITGRSQIELKLMRQTIQDKLVEHYGVVL